MAVSQYVTFGLEDPIIGPKGPTNQQNASAYNISRTGAGAAVVYETIDPADAPMFWTLEFNGLTAAEKASLEAAWTTAAGPSNTFSYIHTDGVTYTARFLNESLVWVRHAINCWDIVIQLEISPPEPEP